MSSSIAVKHMHLKNEDALIGVPMMPFDRSPSDILKHILTVYLLFFLFLPRYLSENWIQDGYLLRSFRKFTERSWTPAHAGDAYFQTEGSSIALNFIDFCADVGGIISNLIALRYFIFYYCLDFNCMPKCSFQYYQAYNIFQTYIMHGATKRVI